MTSAPGFSKDEMHNFGHIRLNQTTCMLIFSIDGPFFSIGLSEAFHIVDIERKLS